jgi:hypothetical protein
MRGEGVGEREGGKEGGREGEIYSTSLPTSQGGESQIWSCTTRVQSLALH